MPYLKRMLRRGLAQLLYYSGMLWIYAAFKLRDRAVVLMYHRILPAGADSFSHEGIMVTPRTFAAHMRFLRRHFRPLTQEQFGAELLGRGFGRRACLVTFDDGWWDNAGFALPILERYEMPAAVFIATAFIGTGSIFWQERLTRLLYRASRSPGLGDDVLRDLGAVDVIALEDAEARRSVARIVSTLKQGEPIVPQRLIDRLEAAALRTDPHRVDYGEDRFLDWHEVRKLHESGLVTIGSHAHTHTPLPSLGYAGARTEFERSSKELQAHGLPAARICAYPNGDVNDAVAAAATDAGFVMSFATGRGRVRNGDDPLRLRRINVHESSSGTTAEFLCLILGVI